MLNHDNNRSQKLAHRTEIMQNLRRLGRGIGAVRKSRPKLGIWVSLLALLGIVWGGRHQFLGYEPDSVAAAPLDVLTGGLLLLLAAVLTTVLLWTWGGPWQAGKVQDNLYRIGLVNHAGEPPTLLSVTRHPSNPKLLIYTFYTCGLPVETWLDCADKIQSALNGTIVDIRYDDDHQTIQLSLAPPSTKLPKNLLWQDAMTSPNNFEFILGESPAGPVKLNLALIAHVLIGGSTGSGKTVLLKLILRQAFVKGAEIYIADFKDGIDYNSDFWQDCCEFCEDLDGLEKMLDVFKKARKERKKLFKKYRCNNIDEYNRMAGSHQMKRMIFACDEAAELFDKTGKSKEERQRIDAISSDFESIARVGRAYGFHLILATQRPDANVIPGQIKSNIDYRICGRADPILSEIILGSRIAADLIPRASQGRFITNEGIDNDRQTATVFQAYRLSDRFR